MQILTKIREILPQKGQNNDLRKRRKFFDSKNFLKSPKFCNLLEEIGFVRFPSLSLLFPCTLSTNQRRSADFLAQSPSKQRLALRLLAQSDLTSTFDPTDSKSNSAQSQRRQKETPRKKVKNFSHKKHLKIFQIMQKKIKTNQEAKYSK